MYRHEFGVPQCRPQHSIRHHVCSGDSASLVCVVGDLTPVAKINLAAPQHLARSKLQTSSKFLFE